MMLSAGLATPPGPTHSEAPVSRTPAPRPRLAGAGFAFIAIGGGRSDIEIFDQFVTTFEFTK